MRRIQIWANYNDLTATSLESCLIRGIIPKQDLQAANKTQMTVWFTERPIDICFFQLFPVGEEISFVEVVETNMYILTVDGDESNNSFIPNIEPAFSSQVYLIRVVAAVGCGLACEYFNSRMRMTSTTYRKHPNYMHPSTQELWI